MPDDLPPKKARASALCRGLVHAYGTSVMPYGVSVSGFLILAAVVPPGIYAIFMLWYAFLLLLGLIVAAPFFAWPLRNLPIGSTFATLRSLWSALAIYLTGIVMTVVAMWVVTLFYETGGGIVQAAGIIGWYALFLIPGAFIAWGLLSLLERLLHKKLASRPQAT